MAGFNITGTAYMVMLLYGICNVYPFLLDDECMAPPPCSCSSSYVRCDNKNLASFPELLPIDRHMPYVNVYLSSNHIVIIPARAFTNISSVNASQVHLQLYNNKINSVDANAFAGIENVTDRIQLQNNNLTSIPAALGHLPALLYLNLQNNPIQSLDSSLMSSIGHSLTQFTISIDHFTTWPTQIHLLRKLTHLVADKIPFSHLDVGAFHGLEYTLTSLTISNSKLERIPTAVCHLIHLQSLTYSGNPDTLSPITFPCHMKSVTTLSLDNNNLQEFPSYSAAFLSLTSLYLQNNHIRYIDTGLIPAHSNITTLYLYGNQFSRIPTAVRKLKSLSTLYMSNNKILTVEDSDLWGLTALTQLYLYSNPLEYISPHAFKTNTHLSYLNLYSTQLGKIPRAVLDIPHLANLYLNGKPNECTCNMAYLKPWNVTSVNIDGTCESSTETLKEFLLKSLPKCP